MSFIQAFLSHSGFTDEPGNSFCVMKETTPPMDSIYEGPRLGDDVFFHCFSEPDLSLSLSLAAACRHAALDGLRDKHAAVTSPYQHGPGHIGSNLPLSPAEDAVHLVKQEEKEKEKDQMGDEIATHFPRRSRDSLLVH